MFIIPAIIEGIEEIIRLPSKKSYTAFCDHKLWYIIMYTIGNNNGCKGRSWRSTNEAVDVGENFLPDGYRLL